MKMFILKSVLFLGVVAITATTDTVAQGRSNDAPGRSGGAPGNSGNAPGHNKPSGVPIDGGASILLAAGAAYGLKKMRDYRNSKNGTIDA
ncbi:PID-CTERM protein-sorting domain-containing protein [uncultured Pontibacter sp.]|uniref:PID-CTERM protein-sorting domain-containing protein n=1 Tax=uncultured Pontibacter sp. TaxID=453356 RepID=UPI0026195CB2|nr:hypothetical protein [uncultured Pontibacter sp.]